MAERESHFTVVLEHNPKPKDGFIWRLVPEALRREIWIPHGTIGGSSMSFEKAEQVASEENERLAQYTDRERRARAEWVEDWPPPPFDRL